MRSTLRPTGTPYRMSVATASAVFRVRLTRTISRALPRTTAAMAEAQPTLPVPTIPIFIGPSGVGRSQRDDSDDRYHSSPFSLHMILRLSSERWRGRRAKVSQPTVPHFTSILGRKLADRRPVERVTAMGQQCQEPVTQQARERHGDAEVFRGRERQTDVFVTQWCRKTGGFDFSIGDQPAISFVNRGAEQRRGQDVEIFPRIDAALADERHGLAEGFDDRSDQEIAAELHKISSLRIVGDDKGFLPDRVEERCCGLDRIRCTGRDDKKLAYRGHVGTTEHWRRDETLTGFCMSRRQSL